MFDFTVLMLIISFLIVTYSIVYTNKHKKESKAHYYIYILFVMLDYWILCMLSQYIFANKLNINPVYFEYFTGIVAEYIPIITFMLAITYLNNDAKTKKYNWIYIFPTIMLISLWTNNIHHLFYVSYSTLLKDSQNGILFTMNAIYGYVIFAITGVILLRKSYMKSGFFSKQTIFLVVGLLIPLAFNILGAFKIISMSVYITPILFTATSVCFSLAIIVFKGLNVTPVAFKTVIDTMSDAFVVISDDGTIADMNKTFENTFKDILMLGKSDNLFDIIKKTKIVDFDKFMMYLKESKDKNKVVTREWSIQNDDLVRYFDVDIQGIKAKKGNEYVATLLLFRDITVQKKDMEILTKNENLVILGELAGGVAHDINTPISAIKSGLLMFKDMVKTPDEKMLITRMDSCADKIIALVNSLRNQIRNIGSDEKIPVDIAAVIKDTSIIIGNELIKTGVKLNMNIKDNVIVIGEPTKLGQVITNLVMNAVQAYEGQPGIIDVDLYKSDKNEAVITVEDYAGGIPESIKPYIFKNILTTKGVSGTGFGLYLAYSVIKGAFGGDMIFTSVAQKGTKFIITIPIDQE